MSIAGIKLQSYSFDVASDVWMINHNLGFMPTVEVLTHIGGVLTKVLPLSIEYPDVDTVIVKWTVARTGEVMVAMSQF